MSEKTYPKLTTVRTVLDCRMQINIHNVIEKVVHTATHDALDGILPPTYSSREIGDIATKVSMRIMDDLSDVVELEEQYFQLQPKPATIDISEEQAHDMRDW
jgi:hypothetical protein